MTVSVCLSVRQHICVNAGLIASQFLCVLPVAGARSSFIDFAICYVLPVLWMTSCFSGQE